MAELKPCPFCGKSVYLEKVPLWRQNGTTTHGYFGHYEFVVKCRNIQCGCSVNLFQNDTVYRSEDKAKENAINAWNRRTDNGDR